MLHMYFFESMMFVKSVVRMFCVSTLRHGAARSSVDRKNGARAFLKLLRWLCDQAFVVQAQPQIVCSSRAAAHLFHCRVNAGEIFTYEPFHIVMQIKA